LNTPNSLIDYDQVSSHVENLPWCALVANGGRVGSDFFQSLLDGHPEIFVFNGQVYFHEWWAASPVTQFDGSLNADDIIYDFIGAHLNKLRSQYDYFERKGYLGETEDQSVSVDLDEFRRHMRGLCSNRPITSKFFLTSVYVAYALCVGQDVMIKRVFFHHVHHIRKLDNYLGDFPDSKVICMIRDPRTVYVSGVEHWRKHSSKADNPSFPLYVFWRITEEARPLLRYDSGRVRALRLEDLGNRDVLDSVCKWLGISYEECLQNSTWAGLRWWGDQLSPRRASQEEKGFSKAVVRNNWESKLRPLDVYVIDYLISDRLAWFGYPSGYRYGTLAKFIVPLLILFPTTFERRYLGLSYLIGKLKSKNFKDILRSFYHPARRIKFYFTLYIRQFMKAESWLQPFGPHN